MSKARSPSRLILTSVLVIGVAFAVLPLLWIVIMSLQGPKTIIAVPPRLVFRPTLVNYFSVLFPQSFTGVAQAPFPFLGALQNTLIIAVGAVAVSLTLGIPAAYALARFSFKFRENLAFTLLSFYFAPPLAIILPLFMLYQHIGLYNTFAGLILAYQVVTLPLTVWLLRSYFNEVPAEVDESAFVDGSGVLRTLLSVDLPIILPGLAATTILLFIFAWNNFTLGLLLAGPNTETLTVATLGYISYGKVLWGPLAAATVLSIIPEVLIALWFQRYLVRGLSFGAIK